MISVHYFIMSLGVFDQQTNRLLVKEVEKRPILYNHNHPGYTLMHKSARAWREIGKILKLTGSDCKMQWKNIRAAFVRSMQFPHKKAYYLADALQFTLPYCRAKRKQFGNQPQLQPKEETFAKEDSGDDDDVPLSKISLQSSSSVSPSNSSSSILTPTSALLQNQDCQYEPIIQHIPKREYTAENKDVFIEYLNRINKTSSAEYEQEVEDSRKEALKMFFLSMLPDLMKMDDQQLREFKRKILDVVDDIMFIR